VFGNIIVVVFQSVFYSKMLQNNNIFIFKKLFLTSTYQDDVKTQKKINLKKIKNFKFF
jgi:hypothetical protein